MEIDNSKCIGSKIEPSYFNDFQIRNSTKLSTQLSDFCGFWGLIVSGPWFQTCQVGWAARVKALNHWVCSHCVEWRMCDIWVFWYRDDYQHITWTCMNGDYYALLRFRVISCLRGFEKARHERLWVLTTGWGASPVAPGPMFVSIG